MRKLLWRHLWAKHSRPAVRWMNRFAFLGLSLSVFAWISVSSIMDGLQKDIKQNHLKQSAHLLWEGKNLQNWRELKKTWHKNYAKDFERFNFKFQTEVLLEWKDSEGERQGGAALLEGVEELEEGSGAMLGSELWAHLNLLPGENIWIRSPWRLELQPLQVEVQSLFSTGVYQLDRRLLRYPRQELLSWLGVGDAINRVEIFLKDPYQATDWQKRFQKDYSLNFKSWKETHASLWYSLKLEKWVMFMIFFFVVILAVLAIYMALSVRVSEKIKELALLQALGFTRLRLQWLYVLEGALLGLAASLTGMLLAWLFCFLLSSKAALIIPSIYYSTDIPIDWNIPKHLLFVFVAVLLALLASYFPARRVAHLDISDILRS